MTKRKRDAYESDIVELDLPQQELKKRIVKPYCKGKKFICDSKTVDPYDIREIKITETKEDSSQILSKIRRKREIEKQKNKEKKRAVVTLTTEESDVVEYGNEVTSQFITKPIPKKKKTTEGKYVSFFPKKNLKWLLPIILTAYLGIVLSPLASVPHIAYVNQYDQQTKFFPNDLFFKSDSELGNYISELNLYISKIGGNPAILYIKLSDPSGKILSRSRGKTNFMTTSESSQWIQDKTHAKLEFEILENSSSEKFRIYVEYGTKYYVYPIFGLHVIRINVGSSYQAWCEYEKYNDRFYKWNDSSFTD